MKNKSSRDFENFAALVTGASSGIGAATAVELARHGLKVALVARRADRLEQLAEQINAKGGRAAVIAADLSQEGERELALSEARAALGPIDVLVNNAGTFWYGYTRDMSWGEASRMLRLDIEAMLHLTLTLLPEMIARNRGYIITIGSIAADLPNQGIAVYSGVKAFLQNFTTALYRELRSTGVHACTIKPGAVATEFFRQAANEPHGRYLSMEHFGVGAERVAASVWKALIHPRRQVYMPGVLAFTPWVEPLFGWFIDRLGPLLLRWDDRRSAAIRRISANTG